MKASGKLLRAGALLLFLTGVLQGQTTTLETQRAVVVKLQAHFKKYEDETGAGLLVGKDQQYAYFITVRHAVIYVPDRPEEGPPQSAESVTLQFFGSPQKIEASISKSFDRILDLAVVSVPVATLPPNLPQVVRKEAIAGTPVRLVGHPAAGEWTVWLGTVANENAPEGDSRHFVTTSNPSLAHGYSGGPEFNPDGEFLGMQVAYEPTYGLVAKGAEIVAQLKAWQIPTNNLLDAPPEADEDALKRILRLYEAAYNQRDANALWKIWPSPAPDKKQGIKDYFNSTTSITRTLQNLDIKIASNGSSATVNGLGSVVATFRDGNQSVSKNKKVIFSFKKNDGVWTITDVK